MVDRRNYPNKKLPARSKVDLGDIAAAKLRQKTGGVGTPTQVKNLAPSLQKGIGQTYGSSRLPPGLAKKPGGLPPGLAKARDSGKVPNAYGARSRFGGGTSLPGPTNPQTPAPGGSTVKMGGNTTAKRNRLRVNAIKKITKNKSQRRSFSKSRS